MSTTDEKTSVSSSSPSKNQATDSSAAKPETTKPLSQEKGKGKAVNKDADLMDEDDEDEDDDDDDDDEEDYEMEEDEEEDEEDEVDKIDPSAILSTGRRTRGIRIDYSSKEAQERAGVTGHDDDEED